MNEIVVSLPATHVTAYEDRAEVTRVGTVELPAGPVTLRVDGVPALTSDPHTVVSVVLGGAEVLVDDVEVVRGWQDRLHPEHGSVAQLNEQLQRADAELEQARVQLARATERRTSLVNMVDAWAQQAGRALWPHAEQAAGAVTQVDAFASAVHDADQACARARHAHEEKHARVQELRGMIGVRGASTRQQVTSVCVRFSSGGGPATVRISSVMACALWRPAHELRVDNDGRATWRTSATVWQLTGEDWSQVELRLSTARPGAGARLPALTEDRLSTRQKTAEERRTIVVQHRQETVAREDLKGAAPGVYDGGVPRQLQPRAAVTIPSDGRPHAVAVDEFTTDARTELVVMPEYAAHVFVRASLRNMGSSPLLAGPVRLVRGGTHVGVGDIPYVGPGESLDVSLGSEDRFVVRYQRRREDEERRLQRNLVHFVQDVQLSLAGVGPETVNVLLREPVSELAQLKVVRSDARTSPGVGAPDEHGIVRVPVQVEPGRAANVKLAFHLETSGDVVVPDPW